MDKDEVEKAVELGAEFYEQIRQSGITIEAGFFALSTVIVEVGKAIGVDPRNKFNKTLDHAWIIRP